MGDLLGEHHCTVCTIVTWWWGGAGAGFNGLQVTSFLTVCQHLWLGSSVEPRLKPDVRQRLPFPQWLSCPIGGRVGCQISGAEALKVRPDLAVLPQVCTLPSPSTATLATDGKEEHVLVRKITKGANLQAGCLRRPRIPPTCHLCHHHQ